MWAIYPVAHCNVSYISCSTLQWHKVNSFEQQAHLKLTQTVLYGKYNSGNIHTTVTIALIKSARGSNSRLSTQYATLSSFGQKPAENVSSTLLHQYVSLQQITAILLHSCIPCFSQTTSYPITITLYQYGTFAHPDSKQSVIKKPTVHDCNQGP
jgi:hypothetical protein